MSKTTGIDRARIDEAGFPPELRALLACARSIIDPENLAGFRAALAACPSADRLCQAAVTHGMLGHLHRLATAVESGAVDPALVQRLAGLQRSAAHRNLRQTGCLLRVLEQLRVDGVEAMPYKGPAWAERLYGDIGLRTWADLDVLVAHEQVLRARDTLLSHGFVDGNRFNLRLLRHEHRGGGQVAFSAMGQGVHVEVHWELTAGFSARSLRPELLFARAGHLRLLGREVLSPSAVDLLLITCLNGSKDRWDKVERLLGLALQVRDTPSASWGEIVAAARTAGCARRVTTGIAHVCRMLGLNVPPEVAEAVAHDAVARALLRSLGLDSLVADSSAGRRRKLTVLFWRFATEDSAVAGVRHALVRFFRPGPEDWEALAVPPRAEWLYYLLRPPRLAIKWAKRL